MSRFSGPQKRGAMRDLRALRRKQAEERAADVQERLRQEEVNRKVEQAKLDRKMKRLGSTLDDEGHIIGGTRKERAKKKSRDARRVASPADLPVHITPAGPDE